MSDQPRMVPRRYHIFLQLENDAALVFDRQLLTALNRLGFVDRDSAGYGELLVMGLHAFEEQWKAAGKDAPRWLYFARELEKVREENTEKRTLAHMYEEKGLEKFIEWCQEAGIDAEKFLEEYDLQRQMLSTSKSDRYLLFLEQLLREGQEYAVADIRKLAEEADLVHGDTDWQLMKVLASRCKYTRRYGFWSMSSYNTINK